MTRSYLILIFCLLTTFTTVCAETPSKVEEADQYLKSKDYGKAAMLYQQILDSDKSQGNVWFKLGQCYQEQGQDQKALDAYQEAEKNQFPASSLHIRKSRLYARLHQNDKALELLDSLASLGFSNVDRVKNEKDFASLESDSRFGEIMKKIDHNAHPCETAEFKDFDFWVGEWDVTSAGSPAGSSRIQKILNNCVILENYSGTSGYEGKSFNSYDPKTKQWHQYWIDNSGSSVDFRGKYADGQLVYEADSENPDGSKVHRKMTFVKLAEDRVRQFSVQTQDGGKTWNPEYDLLYIRKK
jgi:tetratricopeptide (TPR) repeat protein